MESERNTRLIALVALVAAVGGLSLGFSAFTRNLDIQPQAEVTLDKDVFKVEFSNQSDSVDASNVTASGEPGEATGEEATIVNGDKPTISNLKAKFTKPGQKVTYSFYAVNSGSLDAYLTNIEFKNITSKDAKKECTPKDGGNPATADTLTSVCEQIKLTVTVDTSVAATTTQAVQDEHKIEKYASETYHSHPVKVEIEYPENAPVPDGDFEVKFGDVELTYSSTKPAV